MSDDALLGQQDEGLVTALYEIVRVPPLDFDLEAVAAARNAHLRGDDPHGPIEVRMTVPGLAEHSKQWLELTPSNNTAQPKVSTDGNALVFDVAHPKLVEKTARIVLLNLSAVNRDIARHDRDLLEHLRNVVGQARKEREEKVARTAERLKELAEAGVEMSPRAVVHEAVAELSSIAQLVGTPTVILAGLRVILDPASAKHADELIAQIIQDLRTIEDAEELSAIGKEILSECILPSLEGLQHTLRDSVAGERERFELVTRAGRYLWRGVGALEALDKLAGAANAMSKSGRAVRHAKEAAEQIADLIT